MALVLTPEDAIDLQLHTVCRDGVWTPEALLDYLIAEGFSLAATTDHDRVDVCVGYKSWLLLINSPYW